MMGSASSRYASRSLRRNLRRTILSVFGVAFGVGVGLLALAWMRGEHTMVINAAASGGIGHLRVVPEGWNERRGVEMRLPEGWESTLESLRARDDVAVATPRARVGGLLGMGTRSAHVQLMGVAPATEQAATRYVRTLHEGRYLEDTGEIVLGLTLVERLRAELGDELVVTAVDDEGEMQSALLVLVGIAATGSRDIDASIAHVDLRDVEMLSGRPGAAEITFLLEDVHAIDDTYRELQPTMPSGTELLTWVELSPELRQGLEGDGAFFDFAVIIILFVVLLGVASAQLTGVLERRKEFAVLAALGMRGLGLVQVVVTEGLLLGLASALVALAWAAPLLYTWNADGLDLSKLMESEGGWAMGGVLLDPMFHPGFGAWLIPTALALSLTATIVASLYPAWFASRTDPASALRVDR